MWFNELDTELVKTETLQGLGALHVSLYLIKTICDGISSRT